MAALFSNNLTNYNPAQAQTPQQQWFFQQLNKMNPQLNYTTDSFNNAVKAGRTDLAYTMLQQGGEGYRQAVRQANGWDMGQLNSVINSYGLYGTNGGQTGMATPYNTQTIADLKSFGATSPTTPTYSNTNAYTHNNAPVSQGGIMSNLPSAIANTGGQYGTGYTGFGNSDLAYQGGATATTPTTTTPQQGAITGNPNYHNTPSGPMAPPPNQGNYYAGTPQGQAPLRPRPNINTSTIPTQPVMPNLNRPAFAPNRNLYFKNQ